MYSPSNQDNTATGRFTRKLHHNLLVVSLLVGTILAPAFSIPAQAETVTGAGNTVNNQVTNNTSNTTENNLQAKDTGVAVNGGVSGSSINSNANNLTTGNNTNLNVISPETTIRNAIAGGSGVGGNSVLMMPRNPLPLPNAALGRSNFGLQFGLQNYPVLGNLGSLGGKQGALGWFMQAGLTVPFGKIPEPYQTGQMAKLDDMREESLARSRNVFGKLAPTGKPALDVNGKGYDTKVQGKIVGMGAYNYSTLPSAKINLPAGDSALDAEKLTQPKLLALSPAEVYDRPLNTGEKVGVVEVGNEYAYLGHTKSGWIKVLLPNGKPGWTSTRFEYIKNDFTEIDSLALDPKAGGREKTAISLPNTLKDKGPGKPEATAKPAPQRNQQPAPAKG